MKKAICIAAMAGLLAAISVTGAADAPATPAKVDMGAFTKEVMKVKTEGGQADLALWFPQEFFVESCMSTPGAYREQIEKDLAFLKPFIVIMVESGTTRSDGTVQSAPEQETRSRAVLKLASGLEMKPLENIPPSVATTVAAMQKSMRIPAGQSGANMRALVFPAMSQGKPVVETRKKSKLTLVLKAAGDAQASEFTWRTPFDTTSSAVSCPKCRGESSVKWSYCPWCGTKLAQ
jgi:hypothetical protein